MYILDKRANDILEDTVKRVRSIKGGPGIRVINSPLGITISLNGTNKTVIIPPVLGAQMVTGFLTGNATGKAKYTGKSFKPITSDVSASTDLSTSDLGGLAASNDCLVCNLAELSNSTTGHDVTAATNTAQFAIYFIGLCRYTNANGTKVIEALIFFTGC